MHLLRNQVPPTQGSLAARSPLQSSLAVRMKTKTRRYVSELVDVYWVAGLGWVCEVKFLKMNLVLFCAFLIKFFFASAHSLKLCFSNLSGY